MYRGSHPTPSGECQYSPTSTAMLLNMSRPPSIPSHPGPPHSHGSHPAAYALSSRPEPPDSGQHVRLRDSSGIHSNAQQLPSLRTLLEPELLEKKSSKPPLRSGSAPYSYGAPTRYDSESPTLKRRHDFDGYAHGYHEHNAITSQTPYTHRPSLHSANNDTHSAASSTPGSTFSTSRAELQCRGSYAYVAHPEQPGQAFRPQLIASESVNSLARQTLHDDLGDANRPVRRRIDGSSRAPVRSSRCIGQREMQGEGLCYIYEDGTYCRATIDGEPVNPSWGITKAGKPRKRLAQACLTCREKKIKCEPGYPKCHQCTKSQRVCRGGLNQAGIVNASGETSPSHSTPLFKDSSSEVLNAGTGPDRIRAPGELREYSKKVESWNAGTPFKPRTFPLTSFALSRDMSVHSVDSDWSGSGNEQGDDPRRGSYQDHLALQWEQDPYETDPRLTLHLLDLYFLHAGRATYGMFPRRPFIAWVENNREKSQDQLMLLYTTLAMGSLFSGDPDKRTLGKRFASVASYAAEKRFGKFTLQLCQSRLMLALYFFALGKSQEAWDFCGAGLRAISALKLNTEEGIKELADSTADPDFGFDCWTYEECCRRTFWSGLLMDVTYDVTSTTISPESVQRQRYNGFFGGTLFVTGIEDTYIRLPCPDDMYEASTPCDAPYFNEDFFAGQAAIPPRLGQMAYLCLISALWGEVLTFTGRAARRPLSSYERQYEAFYANMYEKLDAWYAMLPSHLHFNLANLENSMIEGNTGNFISLHALYHTTIIRLNRHIRVNALPADKVRRNVEHSFRNASNFLSMMHSLASVSRQRRLPPHVSSEFSFSTPFPGYALMLSIDVLASAGTFLTLTNLIETIGTAMSCIDELASFWASARAQQRAVSSRVKQLTDISAQEGQGVQNGSYSQFWRLESSLETAFGNDDAIFKADNQLLFDVVAQFTSR
ncbi:hypothetical protein BDU57DRAFT_122308 [Ampelomyces quisqualis]|uniref:Zn(2)-C6 fungal-type domain-containing protein n=1 Tax=Ampelomyces quisqualis TaxID=50730 RepID=A0A6A5QSW6_AMPQU|nr:hypothetical protein BDU57DRAFT_122308 [Ampelomyces quisqualis]